MVSVRGRGVASPTDADQLIEYNGPHAVIESSVSNAQVLQ